MSERDLPTYTDEEIEAIRDASQDDPEAYAILQGILDIREANRYAQDQED